MHKHLLERNPMLKQSLYAMRGILLYDVVLSGLREAKHLAARERARQGNKAAI